MASARADGGSRSLEGSRRRANAGGAVVAAGRVVGASVRRRAAALPDSGVLALGFSRVLSGRTLAPAARPANSRLADGARARRCPLRACGREVRQPGVERGLS